ncbi:MAG: exo-alpha-sialidase [Phycisphaerae bacterium]
MHASRILMIMSGVAAAAGPLFAEAAPDPRNIRTGREIPSENYADQPYVAVLPDGAWLCVLTTGPGREGARGQHVVATRSTDRGRTWSPLVDIEPAGGPEASWVVPLVTPFGRVYAFYDYNGDRVRTLRGKTIRADMLGWYAYRYSDDGGRTWSDRRRLPMRVTACDRGNDWRGKVQVFWGVSKPVVQDGAAFFGFTKLGKYMLDQGEGWVYRSGDALTERDAAQVHWDLLPEGDRGIRRDGFGSVQEEHVVCPMDAPGSLLCVYRATTGYACQSRSTDGGRRWSEPRRMTYTPGGRPVKNPRANVKAWRTADGRYLLWYHNHSGRSFQGRNPAWLASGVEKDGRIHWSQPEIVLYDPDPKVRMSYPDLVQQDGRFWITETQKSVARVHAIDRSLLEGLWNQFENRTVATDGLALDLPAEQCAGGVTAPMPNLPDLSAGGGFSLGVWLRFERLAEGQTVLDTRDGEGRGLALITTGAKALRLVLSDGTTEAAWETDPGALSAGRWQHVVATIDGGPKIVTFVVDGRLCDGGEARQYGWGRFPNALGRPSGSDTIRIAPRLDGRVGRVRVYDRYLRTSEAVGNFRAGR